jgi:hypothetical protein
MLFSLLSAHFQPPQPDRWVILTGGSSVSCTGEFFWAKLFLKNSLLIINNSSIFEGVHDLVVSICGEKVKKYYIRNNYTNVSNSLPIELTSLIFLAKLGSCPCVVTYNKIIDK